MQSQAIEGEPRNPDSLMLSQQIRDVVINGMIDDNIEIWLLFL